MISRYFMEFHKATGAASSGQPGVLVLSTASDITVAACHALSDARIEAWSVLAQLRRAAMRRSTRERGAGYYSRGGTQAVQIEFEQPAPGEKPMIISGSPDVAAALATGFIALLLYFVEIPSACNKHRQRLQAVPKHPGDIFNFTAPNPSMPHR
jgi:hypothetical protein